MSQHKQEDRLTRLSSLPSVWKDAGRAVAALLAGTSADVGISLAGGPGEPAAFGGALVAGTALVLADPTLRRAVFRCITRRVQPARETAPPPRMTPEDWVELREMEADLGLPLSYPDGEEPPADFTHITSYAGSDPPREADKVRELQEAVSAARSTLAEVRAQLDAELAMAQAFAPQALPQALLWEQAAQHFRQLARVGRRRCFSACFICDDLVPEAVPLEATGSGVVGVAYLSGAGSMSAGGLVWRSADGQVQPPPSQVSPIGEKAPGAVARRMLGAGFSASAIERWLAEERWDNPR
jgi:hypothetical protein